MNGINLSLCAALTITLVASAEAGPVPSLNLASLVGQADIVALGSVVSVARTDIIQINTNNRSLPGRIATAEIEIDAYLKGWTQDHRIKCRNVELEGGLGYGRVAERTYRLVFLANAENDCTFTSPYYPTLPAAPVPRVDGTDPEEKLAAAIDAFLWTSSLNQRERLDWVEAIGTLRTPRAISVLQKASHDQDAALRIMAAAVLLSKNDATGIAVVEHALLHARADVPTNVLGRARSYVSTIGNVAAIPSLVRLLGAADAATRQAAAHALRNTRSGLAIAPLVRALDDEDSVVQYTAVIALAEITGNRSHAPSIPLFEASPGQYIDYWKAWAKAQKDSR